MDQNFLRRYIIRCGEQGKKGFEIGNVDGESNPLHVSFSIEKSDAESPNNAKIQIWNLSNENIKVLENKKCILELKAGYADSTTLLIVGNVVSSITTLDNADRMTEIEVADGMVQLKETNLSLSYNGKVNCKDLYQSISKKMGVSVVFAKDLTFKTLPNGFSYVGKAKNALQKVAGTCGHKWTIQNGVLQITKKGKPLAINGYLLSKETGLLGVPKRISIGEEKEKKTGFEIEYFLNGAIGVNDVIQVKSSIANGYFFVKKVTINGDNLEGDWTCTAQILNVSSK